MSSPRRIAVGLSVVTSTLLVAGMALAVRAGTEAAFAWLALSFAVAPAAAVLSVLITRRGDGAVVGVALGAVASATAFTATRGIGWQAAAQRPEVVPRVRPLLALLNESAWWLFVAVALLCLYFPDGRLPSRRWRFVPAVLVLCAGVEQAYGAFEPYLPPLNKLGRPYGPPPLWLEAAESVAFVLLLGLLLASAASLVLRFRRSDPRQRDQIKWLALAGLGIPLYPPLCLLEIAIWGGPRWFSLVLVTSAFVGVPVAVGIAVLRHDLYDVDRALAGTITWVVLTMLLLGAFAGISAVGGLVLGGDSEAAAAGAAAVCALALAPVRRPVQRQVDRFVYPLRRAALDAIEDLQRKCGTGDADPEDVEDVLRTALRADGLRVGLRVPGVEEFVDTAGRPVPPARAIPVALAGSTIGIIDAGDGAVSADLLRQVAARVTTLLEVARLRHELADALREVEGSRARLVQSGNEERRKLERDLHDGAQQRLVSLGMAMRVAQRHLTDGTVDVHGLLDRSVAELGTAVSELRQIANGLRPSSLDDGLPAALAGLVRTIPMAVEMDVCPEPLPDDVATTAYFVASEAITNAVKHAGASCIRLHVTRRDGRVLVTVTDDGRGGAALQPRSGLADRVAALGGQLQVDSPLGNGTAVVAELPCAS